MTKIASGLDDRDFHKLIADLSAGTASPEQQKQAAIALERADLQILTRDDLLLRQGHEFSRLM